MYDYSGIYQIPRRMAKKEGVFGQIRTSDGICAALIMLTALIMMMVMPSLITIVIALFMALFAYLFFIMYDKYSENFKIKLGRMIEYRKKQKIYYYYRGTK